MSVWDNQYYEDEESAPDSLRPLLGTRQDELPGVL